MIGLVGHTNVKCFAVCITEDGDRPNAHLAERSGHADRNLAPIRDEDLAEHRLRLRLLGRPRRRALLEKRDEAFLPLRGDASLGDPASRGMEVAFLALMLLLSLTGLAVLVLRETAAMPSASSPALAMGRTPATM